MRQVLGAIRWAALSRIHRRSFDLQDPEPTVSFTFDDFPQSAWLLGGAILGSCGVYGTYYAAMGLMNKVNNMGQFFRSEDLRALLRAGHELGSHTFSHVSCRTVPLPDFHVDVGRGKRAVEQVTGVLDSHHFSYPYGHATMRGKRSVGIIVSSCRGIVPGINESPVDLNLLRANSLYSRQLDLESIGQLLKQNEKRRGWLIFYTHDISETPSAFGCKPGDFEKVVNFAVNRGARILPVGQVIATFTRAVDDAQIPIPVG